MGRDWKEIRRACQAGAVNPLIHGVTGGWAMNCKRLMCLIYFCGVLISIEGGRPVEFVSEISRLIWNEDEWRESYSNQSSKTLRLVVIFALHMFSWHPVIVSHQRKHLKTHIHATHVWDPPKRRVLACQLFVAGKAREGKGKVVVQQDARAPQNPQLTWHLMRHPVLVKIMFWIECQEIVFLSSWFIEFAIISCLWRYLLRCKLAEPWQFQSGPTQSKATMYLEVLGQAVSYHEAGKLIQQACLFYELLMCWCCC